jgi:hypothetical protein
LKLEKIYGSCRRKRRDASVRPNSTVVADFAKLRRLSGVGESIKWNVAAGQSSSLETVCRLVECPAEVMCPKSFILMLLALGCGLIASVGINEAR